MSRVVQNGQNDSLALGLKSLVAAEVATTPMATSTMFWAKVASQAAYGLEGVVVNDSLSVPYAKGATNVYYAHFNVASAGRLTSPPAFISGKEFGAPNRT